MKLCAGSNPVKPSPPSKALHGAKISKVVEVFKFTPFLVKFTPFARPILCRLNFKSMFLYRFNYCTYCLRGVGQTLKFNLHIIGHTKKGCEFNQKRCELKFFQSFLFKFFFPWYPSGIWWHPRRITWKEKYFGKWNDWT